MTLLRLIFTSAKQAGGIKYDSRCDQIAMHFSLDEQTGK
jgi:hypothetical protein